jgi:hypothetical protein
MASRWASGAFSSVDLVNNNQEGSAHNHAHAIADPALD